LIIFGQYFLQKYFATLDGKRFLLSDIAQDVPVLTDIQYMFPLYLARCVVVAL